MTATPHIKTPAARVVPRRGGTCLGAPGATIHEVAVEQKAHLGGVLHASAVRGTDLIYIINRAKKRERNTHTHTLVYSLHIYIYIQYPLVQRVGVENAIL